MNKIAILIAGWHFPKYFYTQMSNLIVPDGYEFDNFIVCLKRLRPQTGLCLR